MPGQHTPPGHAAGQHLAESEPHPQPPPGAQPRFTSSPAPCQTAGSAPHLRASASAYNSRVRRMSARTRKTKAIIVAMDVRSRVVATTEGGPNTGDDSDACRASTAEIT